MSIIKNKNDNDLTGRGQLIWNLVISWFSYLVLIVAGFIMPRLIDNHVGQMALGVWDFCWAIVSYLNVAGLGIGSSMNRFVAKYQAAGDLRNLKKTISAVAAIQIIVSVIVILFTLLVVFYLPKMFGEPLEGEIWTAQWVVALLGATVAMHMAYDTYRGVITGFHRWDIYNGLHAGSHLILFALMVISLMKGGGLISLAVIYFTVMLFTELVRVSVAYRIYPELELRPLSAEWAHMKMLLSFGSKVVVVGMSPLLLVLTANVFVVSNLGPSTLAILSRPLALLRHMDIFLNKYFHMLTPITGSLMEVVKKDEIKEFILNSTMYGVALTLPIVIILCLYGDLLMIVWMGAKYVNHDVLIILAVGYLLPVSQTPVMRAMVGVNRHGSVGLVSLLIVCTGLFIWSFLLNLNGWSLVGVALMIGTTLTIANGVVMPIYSCNILKIPYSGYLKKVFIRPIIPCVVFGIWLWIIRMTLNGQAWRILLVGIGSGLVILGVLYWLLIIPETIKTKLFTKNMLRNSIAK